MWILLQFLAIMAVLFVLAAAIEFAGLSEPPPKPNPPSPHLMRINHLIATTLYVSGQTIENASMSEDSIQELAEAS
jgi:hypothetical protein